MTKNSAPVDTTKYYMDYQGSASSAVIREVCNSMATGLFIIQIDSYVATTVPITLNVTSGFISEIFSHLNSSENALSSFLFKFHFI